jgi:hypothetical protein
MDEACSRLWVYLFRTEANLPHNRSRNLGTVLSKIGFPFKLADRVSSHPGFQLTDPKSAMHIQIMFILSTEL